ncbi:MAG: helix-turn-helix domain-containing protein [Acidobacteria bacterium]|nr:helix-turn-helix domain-containing protein [Acidobacteriota bacterium]
MSLTLGEKLRQAREERGISISEVAEQTRISPHYLDSIENDDYRTLPGGIFNKGFVKSYAKYVGLDEQEALQDYARLISSQDGEQEDQPKTYRPEVLTDDRASSSMLPTIIFAVIILGLMTWGLLKLVDYIQNQPSQPAANTNTAANPPAGNTNAAPVNANTSQPLPSTNEIAAEIKVTEDVATTVVVDGKTSFPTVKPDAPFAVKAESSLKVSYSKSKAAAVQLTLNGKPVTLPAQGPPNQATIRFEINKENIVQILQSGQIAGGTPPAGAANTNTANTANAARPR